MLLNHSFSLLTKAGATAASIGVGNGEIEGCGGVKPFPLMSPEDYSSRRPDDLSSTFTKVITCSPHNSPFRKLRPKELKWLVQHHTAFRADLGLEFLSLPGILSEFTEQWPGFKEVEGGNLRMRILPFDSFWSIWPEDRISGGKGQGKVNVKPWHVSFDKGRVEGWCEDWTGSSKVWLDHKFVFHLPVSKIYCM